MVKRWHSFGTSVIGPGHVRNDLPNQDSYLSKNTNRFTCIVVADGVGSCKHSDVGSKAVCAAVLDAVRKMLETKHSLPIKATLELVKQIYLKKIGNLNPRDTSTTCLFAIRFCKRKTLLAMLGDGLVAAKMKSGEIISLMDDKSQNFSNIVVPMSPKTKFEDWKFRLIKNNECQAVLLCSDGIADDLEDIHGFVYEYLTNCQNNKTSVVAEETKRMLENWPVPYHSDDKTIACFYRMEKKDDRRR